MSSHDSAGWGPTLRRRAAPTPRRGPRDPARHHTAPGRTRTGAREPHDGGWTSVERRSGQVPTTTIALLSTWASGLVITLLALNARPAVTSVGALLGDISSTTGMSSAMGAAIVAAPLGCFAAGGALAWPLRAWLGTHNTIVASLAILALALSLRVAGNTPVLLAGTIAACLAIAVLAVMLPVVVRSAPESRWTTLTACHTTAIGAGSALGALITPHLATATSWRPAAASWALLAAAGAVAWLAFGHRISSKRHATTPARPANPFRLTPAGTAWSLTLHLGTVCGMTFTIMGWLPQILRDAGVPAGASKWLFTVAMSLGVAIAWLIPKLATRRPAQSGLAIALAIPSMLAAAGLLLAPRVAPWLWAALFGVGMVAVVLAIALIGLRTTEPDVAAALSSLVHGMGFAIAAVLALGIGLLHSLTHSWHWPLAALLLVLCGQAVTGVLAGRPATVGAATPR